MIPIVKEEFESNLDQTIFTIDEKQAGLIISLLRNNIYKNPLLSSIKEVFSNALDEHIKFNVKVPIQITLPSVFNSNITIRDFAKGISKEFMLNQYTKVGLSTKSNSNDSLGGLGLGRMSPLAYADLFTVVSITDDLDGYRYKREYLISKDNEKVFSSFLFEEITEEETGVIVSYPIKKEDFQLVKDYVEDTTKYVTTVSVTINDKSVIPVTYTNVYKSFKAINVGNYWSKLIGLIGGIPNELSFSDYSEYLDKDTRNYYNTISSCRHIVLEIPIGSVDQSADKSIQLSARTKKQITTLLNQVVSDHKEFVADKLIEFKSIDVVSKFLSENNLYNIPFTWNNKQQPNINSWLINIITFRATKSGYSRIESSRTNIHVSFTENSFYFDDLNYDITTKQLKTKFTDLSKVVIVRKIDNSYYNLTPLSTLFPASLPPKKVRNISINTTNKAYKLSRIADLGRQINIDLTQQHIYFSMEFYNKHIRSSNNLRTWLFNYFNCDLYIVSDVKLVADYWICGVDKLNKDFVELDDNYLYYSGTDGYNSPNSPRYVGFKSEELKPFMVKNPNHIISRFLKASFKIDKYIMSDHSRFIKYLISNNILNLSAASFNLKDLFEEILSTYPLFKQHIRTEYLERYINLEDTYKEVNKENNNE